MSYVFTPERTIKVDEFTMAYIETALWSSVDIREGEHEGTPLDEDFGPEDIAPETLEAMIKDCAAFQEAHRELIASDLAQAGTDFWLTRERHGAGFWDGDWPEPDASTLTDEAHAYGEFCLYVGDDGRIHAV